MSTQLDMWALRQLRPLESAEHLTGLTLAELHAVAQFLGQRIKRGATKPDLVGLILGVTHPMPAAALAMGAAEQLPLFLEGE